MFTPGTDWCLEDSLTDQGNYGRLFGLADFPTARFDGLSDGWMWPRTFQELSRRHLVNLACGGSYSGVGGRRAGAIGLWDQVQAVTPRPGDRAFIWTGKNDIIDQVPFADTVANFTAAVDSLLTRGIDKVVLFNQYRVARSDSAPPANLNSAITAICATSPKIVLFDTASFLADLEQEGDIWFDDYHHRGWVYQRLGIQVYQLLLFGQG